MDVLQAYRGDGPLVDALAPGVARVPLPPLVFVALGLLALGVGLAVDARTTAVGTAVGVGAFVVALASGAARPPRRRLQWLVTPALRAGEFGLIAVLGWRAGGTALPVAFALQCAIAFHHYDTVYRLRQQVPGAPAWVRHLGLGWEGRMLFLLVAALAGAFRPVALVLATWCAVLFVSESVVHWVRAAAAVDTQSAALPEDDED